MINVLADRYLYNIRSFLPPHINLELYDPARGLPANIDKAQALLIRTVNSINKQTLPTIPESLQFIGTGSAGTDHVDLGYLQAHDIGFASAAGCNARSVAEYVATALLLWSDARQLDLSGLSAGIVGVGHVGRQVTRLLEGLGVETVGYDPPRDIREPDFISASLEEVLACDILSFHTPLARSGEYPTYHWLSRDKLKSRKFKMVINAARGGVVDESILLKAVEDGRVETFVLDVWENEPTFNPTTASAAFIKTPHIAGYSVQAKNNASRLVVEALLDHFNLPAEAKHNKSQKQIFDKPLSDFNQLSSLLQELHPIKDYDDSLQQIMDQYLKERGGRFNQLRAEFPLRQEFRHIYLAVPFFDRFPVLKALDISVLSDAEEA